MAIEQLIRVDGKEVKLRASALMPRLYRVRFGRDLMTDMRIVQEAVSRKAAMPKDATLEQRRVADFTAEELTIFEDIAYVMAKHADGGIPDSPEEWLDSMDNVFVIYRVIPVLLRMWHLNSATTSSAKKKENPQLER